MAAPYFAGGNVTARAAAFSAAIPTANCMVNSNAATTAFPDVDSIGFIAMANKRRLILAFPVRGHVTDARIRFAITTTVATAANYVFAPITSQLSTLGDLSDVSYTNADQSGTTAWTTAAVQTTGSGTTPGHNVDNTVRSVFTTSTDWNLIGDLIDVADSGASTTGADYAVTPTGDKLADVFNRARKAAIEQGVANFYVLLFNEDEASGANLSIAVHDHSTLPDLVHAGNATKNDSDGLKMEHEPKLCLPTTSTMDVQVRLGHLTWAATGDSVTIEHSQNSSDLPDDAAATGSAVVETAVNLNASSGAADPHNWSLSASSLDANGFRYYRVRFVIQGITYYGERRPFKPIPASGNDFYIVQISDDHQIIGLNPDDPDLNGDAQSIVAQAGTYASIRARVGTTKHPSFCMHGGEGPDFCQTTSKTIFPLKTDGSGVSNSGTSIIATTADDAMEAVRSWFVNSPFPFGSVPILLCISNHAPYHWHGFTANNGGQTNVAQWVLDALIAYKVIPPASVTTGYSQPTGREGQANYAFVAGDTQFIVANVGIDSQRSTVDNPWSEYHNNLTATNEWVLSDAVKTWYLGVVNGSSANQIDIYQHNGLGSGTFGGAVGPAFYDRNDKDTIISGYFNDNLKTPIKNKFDGRAKLNLGHDHCGDYFWWDGLLVHWMATPGEIGAKNLQNGGPFSAGFFSLNLHELSGGANRYNNAGYYLQAHSPNSMTVQYVASLPDPPLTDVLAAWVSSTNVGLPQRGFSDGDVVLELSVPQRSSGRGQRSRVRTRCR